MMDHQKQCVHQHDENCLIGVNDPPEKEKKKHLRYRYNKLCVQRKDNWSQLGPNELDLSLSCSDSQHWEI